MGSSPTLKKYEHDQNPTVPSQPGPLEAGRVGANTVPSKGAAAGDAASEDATGSPDQPH